jgi:hypothetical protein
MGKVLLNEVANVLCAAALYCIPIVGPYLAAYLVVASIVRLASATQAHLPHRQGLHPVFPLGSPLDF